MRNNIISSQIYGLSLSRSMHLQWTLPNIENWWTLLNFNGNWWTLHYDYVQFTLMTYTNIDEQCSLNIDETFSIKYFNKLFWHRRHTGFLRQRSPSIWVDHQTCRAEDYLVSHYHHLFHHCHHNHCHYNFRRKKIKKLKKILSSGMRSHSLTTRWRRKAQAQVPAAPPGELTFELTFWQAPELRYVIFVTRLKIWVQNSTPKTRKSWLFVFTTKYVNPLLFGLTAEVSGVKLPQLNGF